MDLPPGLRLTVEDKPAPADRNAIERALTAYNRPYLGRPKWSRVGVFVRGDSGRVRAGLDGEIYAKVLFIRNLWVDEALRRQGIGSRLLAEAEHRAIEGGCHSAWLDTFSFQGPQFYPRFGYEVFGVLDYPPDHKRYFLKKRLAAEAA
jgi:GNAT superfamily N-acetyltransferase